MTERGKYIVIEGLDGSGKTTQHGHLLKKIGSKAMGVREPGGTAIGEQIRQIIKDGSIPREAFTNVLLFSAARSELIDNVVRPQIQSGDHVISDRNWLSTVAYQTAEGIERIEEIKQISRLVTREFFEPDLLIFIDTKVKTCCLRLAKRGNVVTDYFDNLGKAYFEKVRQAYLENIRQLPNFVIINGDTLPEKIEQEINERVLNFRL